MPARAYYRMDPHWYDRKVLGVDADGDRIEGWTPYPSDALVAFNGVLALADMQPERGTFRSERMLRELLRGVEGLGARYARQVPTLIARGDLVVKASGRLYVDGWDEWQEGDLTVAERMRRYRERKRHEVTNGVTPTVTKPVTASPSDGDRQTEAVRRRPSSGGGGGGGGISRGGGGAPSRARPLSIDDQARAIRENRALLGSSDVTVQRAALRTLRRLDPEGDWQLPEPKPAPAARPRAASS